MTKMIEHTLDLPSMEDLLRNDPDVEVEVEEDETDDRVNQASLNSALAMAEQAGQMLAIRDGDGHADAADEIHKTALKTAHDLIDLGFNVDQRSAATIFEKANMFLKTALDSKDSKRDMQLKAMKLMLDSRKLDLEEKKLNHELGERTFDAEATIVEDRNELIRRAREQAKAEKEG